MKCLHAQNVLWSVFALLLNAGGIGSTVQAQISPVTQPGSKPEANGTAPVQTSRGIEKPAADAQETLERLGRKVRVQQKAVTLPDVMKTLSEQTGLQIESVAYLREHRLSVLFNDISAKDALDTLGQLNDWKWQITAPGHVLLGRPLAQTPRRITDVSLALQAALPRDMRRFVGSGGTLRDAMHYAPGEKGYVPEKPAASISAFQSGDMLGMLSLSRQAGEELAASLKPQILNQKPVAYAKLTPEQQRLLVRVLISGALANINSSQHRLLSGALPPHERDPQNAELTLRNGNSLLIGTTRTSATSSGLPVFEWIGTVYKVDALATGDGRISFSAKDAANAPHTIK